MITLGIIIGLLLAIIVFLATKKYQVPIERGISQLQNKTKQRGEIYTENEELEDLKHYINNLPPE